MSMFAQPAAPSAGGDNIEWKDNLGRLLLVDVLAQEHGVVTAHGTKNPIRANVTVLDGPEPGTSYEDILVFGTVLTQQLAPSVGQKVLGRLALGAASAGKNAPYLLNESNAEEIALAEKWVAENTKPTVTSAAAPF